jgi:hypothetical protein
MAKWSRSVLTKQPEDPWSNHTKEPYLTKNEKVRSGFPVLKLK